MTLRLAIYLYILSKQLWWGDCGILVGPQLLNDIVHPDKPETLYFTSYLALLIILSLHTIAESELQFWHTRFHTNIFGDPITKCNA